MKISYRREMKHNYMIVDLEGASWKNYECRMLTENTIDGILPFQARQVDDRIRFFYEITSRQPLSRILDVRTIQEEEIKRLLLGISEILDRMEPYLLREESILLEPEYIYIEPEKFRVWLCLVPEMHQDFPNAFRKLLEYLLGKVDHKQKECVVLMYGMYQETRKENYGMDDILKFLLAKEECIPSEAAVDDSEPFAPSFLKPEVGRSGKSDRGMEKRYKEQLPMKKESGKQNTEIGVTRNIWDRIRQRISDLFHKKAEQEAVQVPWEVLFEEDDGEKKKESADVENIEGRSAGRKELFSGKMERMRNYVSVESEVEMEPEQDTVLLVDLKREKKEELRRLHALEAGMEDIEIPYYPFVIGKQTNLVDHVLDYDTISRLHLRIDREGEHYYMQDLNSTNGSAVAGRTLENNEIAEVHVGDEVLLSKYRYCFR